MSTAGVSGTVLAARLVRDEDALHKHQVILQLSKEWKQWYCQCHVAFELIQIAAWFKIGIHLLWDVCEHKCEYLISNELVKKARMRECLLMLGQI